MKKNLYQEKANGANGGAIDTHTKNESVNLKMADLRGQLEAIHKSQAVIEFNLDGTIITANDNFLNTMGYLLSELEGTHHRLFVEAAYAKSSAYKEFWSKLNEGEYISGEFKRIHKNGSEVWIQAIYNPILDPDGNPFKVVKFATDITHQKRTTIDYQGQIEAIGKSQAVIEFDMDGTIVHANDNFLQSMGYSWNEVKGRHHRMFLDQEYGHSQDYRAFWDKLNRGEYVSAEFKRLGKGGREVWIQASYNPILDLNGKPFKVVKFATDITAQKNKNIDFQGQIDAIGKSQAVIEFNMDGTVAVANDNFLKTMGYSFREIQGQHHSMFVDAVYERSEEYIDFWAKLSRGEYVSGEFKRLAKGGREVWIQASYNPILDLNGNPFKVVKFATDITAQKIRNSDYQGQLEAIGRSNAVVEFDMKGNVLFANDNFVKTLGYNSLSEIKGNHHRQFVSSAEAKSSEYKEFWETLNRGEFFVGTYTRINKKGEEVFIQASYNPIKDIDGNPYKVVKYALDMTEVIRVIKAMAKGDLSLRCDTSVDNNGLTAEINKSLHTLNSVLSNISQGSDVVAKSSDLLQKKADEMKRSTMEVAAAISQMAQGAQDQASRTDESSQLIRHVMTSSDDMDKKAEVINKAAGKGLESAQLGMKTVKVLVNNMDGIKDAAGDTSQSISVLTRRTQEIGRTLNVITNIASQTNLLALNAAIEAARAGDSGRGFAVVAEEIRKLAEDSRKSAVEIEKIIDDVKKDTQAASRAIEIMESSVKQGSKSSSEAEAIFQEISKSTEETFSASKEIQLATVSQKEAIGSVVKNIEHIVVVSEETAAGTQQVASSSQQMSGGMADIAKAGDELSAVAAELQAGIQQFTLKK